jgi:hypothetical protein
MSDVFFLVLGLSASLCCVCFLVSYWYLCPHLSVPSYDTHISSLSHAIYFRLIAPTTLSLWLTNLMPPSNNPPYHATHAMP